MNIDERIEQAIGDRQIENDDTCGECRTSTNEVTTRIKQLVREVRLVEAGLLAEKVLKLLPKGTPVEADIATTIESHLFRRRKEAEDPKVTLL